MKRTWRTIVIVALVSIIIGLVLVWGSTKVGQVPSVILATLATVIMTVGLVNLISDWLLQRSVTDDLISLVQTDRRLIEAGIDGFNRVEDADWIQLLSLSSKVECFVIDVTQFKSLIWPRILDMSKTSLSDIQIVLPYVGSDGVCEAIAQRVSKKRDEDEKVGKPEDEEVRKAEVEAVRKDVTNLEHDLERECKAVKSSSNTKCAFTIVRSTVLPSYAYLESTRIAAVLLPPLNSQTGLVESHVLVFRTERRRQKYASWFTMSSRALRSQFTAPAFSDRSIEAKGL